MARQYKTRKFLSIGELNTLWDQWRSGSTPLEIGRTVDASGATIRFVIVRRGGVAPARRRRAQTALSLAEREEISRGLAADASMTRRMGTAGTAAARRHHARAGRRARDAGVRQRPLPARDVSGSALTGRVAEEWTHADPNDHQIAI